MAKTIQQTVKLPASPEALFDTYLDSKKHGAMIDATASMSRRVGGTFSVFDGSIRGKNLMIVPKRIVVQSWRAETWKRSDPDSILILLFSKATGGGQIELIHLNVPSHTHQIIKEGWPKHYWKPWKTQLTQA
jgi:activator of HSP90 ATPase